MALNYQFFGDEGSVKVEGVYGLVQASSGNYDHIQRVNIREYKSWCRHCGIHPTHGDILLVGYWYDDDGENRYEPPCEAFRQGYRDDQACEDVELTRSHQVRLGIHV